MGENLTERWRQFRAEVQGATADVLAFQEAQQQVAAAPAFPDYGRKGTGGGGGGTGKVNRRTPPDAAAAISQQPTLKASRSDDLTAGDRLIVATLREEFAKSRAQARSDGGTGLRAQGLT